MGEPALRVLLVEDSADDAVLVCRAAESARDRIDFCRVDSEVAFVAALARPTDLIISKAHLEALDTARVLEMLQVRDLNVPVLVVVDGADADHVVEVMRQGAVDVVAKDRLSRLGAAIDRAVAEDRVRRDVEARLRAKSGMLNAIGESVVGADIDGRITYLNDAVCTFCGVDRDEAIGLPASDLVPPGHGFRTLLGPVSVEDKIGRRSLTATIPSAGGVEVTALLMRSVLTDAAGLACGFVVIGVDMTSRVEAEQLAQERAEQNAAIARISQLALQQPGVATVFRAAAQALAQTLDADLVAVFEATPSSEQWWLRAGIGFPEGMVGRALLPYAPFTLLDVQRTSADAPPADSVPFNAEYYRRDEDIVCALRAAIVVGGEPFGFLEVQFRHDHSGGHEHEMNFLRAMANLLAAAVMRQRLNEDVLRAEEHERRRLSDDIHDDTLQAVLAVALHVEALQRSLHEPEQVAAAGRAVAAARGAGERLRTLMFDLSPEDLDSKGLEEALARMLGEAADEYGFGFCMQGSLSAPVTRDEAVVLFRVAREAVINAGKHAVAANVRITVATRDGGTAVAVEDDGVGIAAAATRGAEPGHVGLARMRDRIALLGGQCDVEALPGAGTRVAFWLPTAAAELREGCEVVAE